MSIMEKPIVFTNLPLCEELCHILVSIDPYEKKDKSVKSDFQWQLLKTRLLLYSESNVIATPAAGMLRFIHVISKKEYLNSGSLSALFQKLKLKVESVGALSLPMYEQCLIYNLIVKLSPFWNKVEKYFVEGRYFLMHRGALRAIELNVILRDDMLMLYASPLRLWLREVSLFDLLPSSNIEDTVSKPFYVDLHSDRQWVHVLPSFKRGHLVFVTNCIPKDSTFEDYQQMRRHWKNTYGYRLPEDDSSPIYVGISFFGNKEFLYPLECVRRGMHMNMDEPNIVAHFAKAVAAKASFVCGNRLRLRNLLELQNMPKIKINERLKWSESGLAELDSELLNKWLFQSDDSSNLTIESQNISLYDQQEQSDMLFDDREDHPDKKEEYENWLTKCSQFIDKLTQGGQKRSFLKASGRPTFNEIILHSPLKADPKSRPSKSPVPKMEEPEQRPAPFKPCFNKIDFNVCDQKQSVDVSMKEQQQKFNITSGNICGAKFGHENEMALTNVVPSAGVPFKPLFKKKSKHHSKGIIKTFQEEKKKASKSLFKSKSITSKSYMNVKKNSSNEEIKKKRKKKKLEMDVEILKRPSSIMTTEPIAQEAHTAIDVQERVATVNDMNCKEDEQMVFHSNMSIIKTEGNNEIPEENQVKTKPESNLISIFDESPQVDFKIQDGVLEEEKSKITSLVSDMVVFPMVYENKNLHVIANQNLVKTPNLIASEPKEDKSEFISLVPDIQELPLMYENKNLDMVTKQNVVKISNTVSSAPKERKKAIILTTAEIENLVFTNQLEKANVPSLCCYLKGRGIPFSKDRKKNVLLEKVKEIIMPGRSEST